MALSELHLALIGAGVAAVAMVWAYNVWQDRKHRKTAERIFGGETTAEDPTPVAGPAKEIVAERQEPTLAVDAPEVPPPAVTDETAAPTEEISAVAPQPVVAVAGTIPMDEIADCTLRFSAENPIAAVSVNDIQRRWSGGAGKPVAWMVRAGASGDWQRIAEDDQGSYREWAVSLQLVDRRGPVSAAELEAFCSGVEALAQQVGAALEALPELEEVVAHAGALDQFCAGVDIQFVLHVVDSAGGTFTGTKLRGLAEAAGLALEGDGLFRARDAAGGEEFSLGTLGAERFDADSLRSMTTHGLTFSIDVPRVSEGRAAFERMLGAARQIAGALGGVLVDAQRAPLSDVMITAISAKTVELQQRMRDGGIDPGSPRALRLFS